MSTDQSIFFLYEFEKYSMPEDVSSYLEGCFVVNVFGDGSETTAAATFSSTIDSNFGSFIQVSESLSFIYNALYLWKSAVELAAESSPTEWPSQEYVRLSLLGLTQSTPSGSITVAKNNYVSSFYYIIQIISGEGFHVYPQLTVDLKIDPILYVDECEFGKNRVLFKTNFTYIIAAIILAGVIFIGGLSISFLINKYKEETSIKLATPIFLHFTVIALMMITASGIFFALEPTKNDVICSLRTWLMAVGIILLISILIAKAWRIHKLFNNKALKKITLTNKSLFKIIGAIVFVQIVYLAIWWIVDLSKYQEVFSERYTDFFDDVYIKECSVNIYFFIIEILCVAFLLLWGGKLAWSVRHATSEFNESATLATTVCAILGFGLLIVAMSFILKSQPNLLVIFQSYMIFLAVIILFTIEFGMKIKDIIKSHGSMFSSTMTQSGSR